LPRDLQLDRGELERGGERGDARLLRAVAEQPRAPSARARTPEVPHAVHRDPLDERVRHGALVHPRLEVGTADRLLADRDARSDRRGARLHADLSRHDLALLDETTRGMESIAPSRAAGGRARAVLLPALLPIREVPADIPDQVRELDRARLDRRRCRARDL